MEGLTGHVFRNVHAECFGGLDRYYTPFIAPPHVNAAFKGCSYKEIDPQNNQGLNVVPQLLTKNADEFVWAATQLADEGYQEVNLNLGCPSKTVTAKGKGAGFLGNLDDLEAFLEQVCAQSPLPVSVKARIGLRDEGEYDDILTVFCKFPLAELIVHPRLQKDVYRGIPRQEAYGATLERAPFPVAYNGDIFSVDDLDALVRAYPATRHVMLGRGILTNPALARMIRGGSPATRQELEHFHDRLFAAYQAEMGGNAVFRMKEWWFYAKFAFADPLSIKRALRKVRKAGEYESAARRIFTQEELAPVARFLPERTEAPIEQ
ncbi:MAG: tRNA dihydrouridine synthase [Eggerthellaceae bacterium]